MTTLNKNGFGLPSPVRERIISFPTHETRNYNRLKQNPGY